MSNSTMSQSAQPQKSLVSGLTRRFRQDFQTYTMIVALVAIWGYFAFATEGSYVSPQNISNLFRQMSVTSLMAAGMVLVIVTGNIDLSVGRLAGYVSVIVAYLQANTWNVYFPDQPALAAISSVILGLRVGTLKVVGPHEHAIGAAPVVRGKDAVIGVPRLLQLPLAGVVGEVKHSGVLPVDGSSVGGRNREVREHLPTIAADQRLLVLPATGDEPVEEAGEKRPVTRPRRDSNHRLATTDPICCINGPVSTP